MLIWRVQTAEQEKQAQADTQDGQTCTQLTRAQGSLQPLEAEAMEQERPPVGDMQAAASEQERTHGVTSAPAQEGCNSTMQLYKDSDKTLPLHALSPADKDLSQDDERNEHNGQQPKVLAGAETGSNTAESGAGRQQDSVKDAVKDSAESRGKSSEEGREKRTEEGRDDDNPTVPALLAPAAPVTSVESRSGSDGASAAASDQGNVESGSDQGNVEALGSLGRHVPVTQHTPVGGRVSVYWDGEDSWFNGTVQEFCQDKGYLVEYDDEEVHWEKAHTVLKGERRANGSKLHARLIPIGSDSESEASEQTGIDTRRSDSGRGHVTGHSRASAARGSPAWKGKQAAAPHTASDTASSEAQDKLYAQVASEWHRATVYCVITLRLDCVSVCDFCERACMRACVRPHLCLESVQTFKTHTHTHTHTHSLSLSLSHTHTRTHARTHTLWLVYGHSGPVAAPAKIIGSRHFRGRGGGGVE